MITSSVVRITPDIAKQWLHFNTNNRPFNRGHSARLAEAMRRGAYVITGQSIIFGQSGRLLNGQHLLHAIVMYGSAIDVLVVRGIEQEEEAFAAMDRGAKRTNAHDLSVRGEKNANNLAAALSWLFNYHNGTASGGSRYSPEPYQIEAALEENPTIRDYVHLGSSLRHLHANRSLMTFAFYAMSRYSQEKMERFFCNLKDGIGMDRDDPVYLLRQRFLIQASSMAKVPQHVVLALVIKAWNAFATGMKIGVLRFDPEREDMPEFIGYPMKQQ